MPGNKPYHVSYLAIVVQRDMPALPKSARQLSQNAIEQRLGVDPIG